MGVEPLFKGDFSDGGGSIGSFYGIVINKASNGYVVTVEFADIPHDGDEEPDTSEFTQIMVFETKSKLMKYLGDII